MRWWQASCTGGSDTNRMGGHVTSGSTVTANKAKKDATTLTANTGTVTSGNCEGCNRPGHSRDSCRLRVHPDFNKEGPWAGSAAEKSIRAWNTSSVVQLPWSQRADGSTWEGLPMKQSDKKKGKEKSKDKDYYGNSRGNNDGERRGNDGGGKGGSGRVHFDDRRGGTPCRTDIVTHLTCNCGGSDINSTYRQCLVSLATSST